MLFDIALELIRYLGCALGGILVATDSIIRLQFLNPDAVNQRFTARAT